MTMVSTAVPNLQEFLNEHFGNVRVLQEDGECLFCGADIAKALGYSSPQSALRRHCRRTVKRSTLTSRGDQSLVFITESDVYRLIIHNNLPSAQPLKGWVLDDVIPNICSHIITEPVELAKKFIDDPDVAIKFFTVLKNKEKMN